MSTNLHISKNATELATAAAQWMVNIIEEILRTKPICTIVLSGGSTPKLLHEFLCNTPAFKNAIPWQKIHFFWGDERYVPFDDERNNAKMAFDTLLNKVPVQPANIHCMPTDVPIEEAVLQYRNILAAYFPNAQESTFDIVLLGMGDDAHTLSLFPNTAIVTDATDDVASLWLASQNMYRITLMPPIVNRAANIAFLVTGTNKQMAYKQVTSSQRNVQLYPAQLIQPTMGKLNWFVDEAVIG